VIGAEKKFSDVNHKLRNIIFVVENAWLISVIKERTPKDIWT